MKVYSDIESILNLFELQVQKQPEAIAINYQGELLTYRQLNNQANHLAISLQKRGVVPEVLVGICAERSLDIVIGILGILKAGAAFVPLDPSYPKERIACIIEETQMGLLITQNHLLEKIIYPEKSILLIDTECPQITAEDEVLLPTNVTSENLAYIMYTSGSTGKPKGVQITRSQVDYYVQAIHKLLNLDAHDIYLHTASFSFSSSIRQLFLPLSQGAQIILASSDDTKNPLSLLRLIQTQNITVFDTLASIWHYALMALEEMDKRQREHLLDSPLRLLLFSGELLTSQLLKKVRQAFKNYPRIINLYGQTETLGVCAYEIPGKFNQEEGYVPVGYPYSHHQCYILNPQSQPLGIREIGELYVAGASLGRGYLNDPNLTSQRFISNPLTNNLGEQLYKTGDLARYLPDRTIEIVGRQDFQIKIRGIRVELGEIESTLRLHSTVKSVVVIGREDKPDDKRLVAYIVPKLLESKVNQKTLIKELSQLLKAKLPDYMMPSSFVLLDTLPITPNGKIDYDALPIPETPDNWREETLVVKPRTATEERLATIWTTILGIKQIGIDDNFFELGGHSLLATQVISRIREAFNVELPLLSLFEAPTLAELSDRIETILWANSTPLPSSQINREEGEL